MCDAAKMLKDMKHLQRKPEPVCCTCSSQCWCNNLSFRFPINQLQEECRSPQQMLDEHGSEMNEADQKYLKRLAKREFILD